MALVIILLSNSFEAVVSVSPSEFVEPEKLLAHVRLLGTLAQEGGLFMELVVVLLSNSWLILVPLSELEYSAQ